MAKSRTRSSEAFFGRRKGPPLQGRKQRVIDELLPELLIDPSKPVEGKLTDLFRDTFESIRLEIGFGGGEHLAQQAAANPEIGFIGVEPFINGMAKMLCQIEDHGLTNVLLYNDDATQLLDWLPESSIAGIDLLYPDPWPKKRHWKRRFVNQTNLNRFERAIQSKGMFRFASDIETYVNWTLNHTHRHGGFEWQAVSAEDWRKPWAGWLRTRYEAKAIREERVPCYLCFQKTT